MLYPYNIIVIIQVSPFIMEWICTIIRFLIHEQRDLTEVFAGTKFVRFLGRR